ncbi:MAG: YidC/Oxa1 family membrane protein insertase [Actinomycetota bacterium]|nr:YidC/Oxa1 family membrane protein insertase [Actinomycetota bacterium]
MIALAWWQGLLGGLGWVLAKFYDFIPSYAVAIIMLTVAIRLVLLPLGIKQIRSMQAMASLQPKIKAIQAKYKGNKQKQTEEMQRLYQEHGVNPLAGCLPMLLQLPVLIALYAVLRFPTNVGAVTQGQPLPYPSSHIPVTSTLYTDIANQQGGIRIGGVNLLCSAGEAGTEVTLKARNGAPYLDQVTKKPFKALDCGKGVPVRIPYYVLALLMVGTTFYQQRQMQKANPVGSQQQQALTRIMPLLFGVWGFIFPAGLVVYWTTSNLWQIGQQHFILKAKEKADAAQAAGDGKALRPAKAKRNWFASMMERATQAQSQRSQRPAAGSGGSRGSGGSSGSKPAGSGSGSKPSNAGTSKPGGSGTSRPSSGPKANPSRRTGNSGGKSAGDRKKRRKR